LCVFVVVVLFVSRGLRSELQTFNSTLTTLNFSFNLFCLTSSLFLLDSCFNSFFGCCMSRLLEGVCVVRNLMIQVMMALLAVASNAQSEYCLSDVVGLGLGLVFRIRVGLELGVRG
jgi:hypothetical protein